MTDKKDGTDPVTSDPNAATNSKKETTAIPNILLQEQNPLMNIGLDKMNNLPKMPMPKYM